MTTNERLIIRDYLLRKRWYYIFGFVLHLAAMTACWWGEKPMFLGVAGGSAFILLLDLNRRGNTITRTMLSLPVAADQLARCWRFVALGFPVVIFLVPLVLSAAIAAAFGALRFSGEYFVLIAIAQTLFLGNMYFIATGMAGQARMGASIYQQARDVCFGLLWGSSLPGLVFLAQAIPSRFEDLDRNRIMVGVLLTVATIAGWFRAGVLVRERVSRPGIGKRKNLSSIRNPQDWKRFGALPYLCLRFGSLTLAMMLAALLFNHLLVGNILNIHRSSIGKSQVGMFVVFASVLSALQLLNQLRTLRAMPIQTSTLTHWLLLFPLMLAMCLWLMAQMVFTLLDGSPIDWQYLPSTVLAASFVGLFVPVSLRYGLRAAVLMPMIVVGTSVVISSQFDRIWGNHWAWLLVGGGVFLACQWWSTCRLLGSPHPWRAGALKWQGMGRRS